MKNAPYSEGAGSKHGRAADSAIIADQNPDCSATTADELQARLSYAPATARTRKAQNLLDQAVGFRHLAKTYTALVEAMLENGLEERPVPPKPFWVERLRLGLETGAFNPPTAADLLSDFDRAQAGNREAQQRIIDYLKLPGVLEALGDD